MKEEKLKKAIDINRKMFDSIAYQNGFTAGQLASQERCLKMIKELNKINPIHLFDNFVIQEKLKHNKTFFYSDFAMFVRDFYIQKLSKKIKEMK